MGPYWAVGCLANLYWVIAIFGVIASIAGIPFTNGLSLFGLLFVFAYLVVAQVLRLLLDNLMYSKRVYQLLLDRSPAGQRAPASPHGAWGEPKPKRGQHPVDFDDEDDNRRYARR